MADTYLMHHGVKGMHWGVRKYQNPDGTLTRKGRIKAAKEARKTGENYRGPRNKKYEKLNRQADRGDILRAKGRDIDKVGKLNKKIQWGLTLADIGVLLNRAKGWEGVVLQNAGTPIASISATAIHRGMMALNYGLAYKQYRDQRDVRRSMQREKSKRKDNRWDG